MDRFRLNLLYFSRGYTTHDRRFLQSFVEAGYHVSYLRLLDERLDLRDLPKGVTLINWVGDFRPYKTPSDFIVRYIALRQILLEVSPHVVLAGPVQTCAFLVALTGYKPLVTMSWGSDLLVEANRNLWTRAVTRYTLYRSQGALGDCQAVRNKIHNFSPLLDDRIATFPWGISLRHFSSRPSALSLRRDLGWIDNPILISTRSWEPIYAIDILVRAFALVHKRRPEARLLLLGDGSQSTIIQGLISELDITEIVYTPGRISYELLPDYFCLANIYVSSALSDGTSVSLLEAMACGLPAVLTNGYGNLEWVESGRNGWLVAPGDTISLADALDSALADPARLVNMKQANIELVRVRADWNKNFPQLLQLLDRVAKSASNLNRDTQMGREKP
jgi:glycosyltransferase involved in cell wall biosynthesis